LSIVARLAVISYRLFRGKLPPIMWPELSAAVKRSLLGVSPRTYAYLPYLTTLLALIAAAPLAAATALLISPLAGLTLLLTAMILGFNVPIIYPYLRVSSLASSIDSRLVPVVGYMALLAMAGRNMDEMLLQAAAAEGPGKPITKVLLRFVRDVKILGMDYLRALEDVVEASPSHRLAVLIASIYESIETSGSAAEYLLSEFRTLVTEKRARLTRSLTSIGHLSEAFIILVMLGPSIALLASLLGGALGIGFAGIPPDVLMALMVVGVIPLATVAVLIILDTVLSEAETI